MGCLCVFKKKSMTSPKFQGIRLDEKARRITIQTTAERNINHAEKRNYVYIISPNSWIRVINFLNFPELKVIGKLNKALNYISKKHEVLTKFFAKKQSKFSFAVSKTGTKVSNSARKMTFPSINSFSKAPITNTIQQIVDYSPEKNIPGVYENASSSSSLCVFSMGVRNMTKTGSLPSEIKERKISIYKNNSPGVYKDYFCQIQLDWNILKNEMKKRRESAGPDDQHHTPTFSFQNNSLVNSLEGKKFVLSPILLAEKVQKRCSDQVGDLIKGVSPKKLYKGKLGTIVEENKK